MIPDPLAAALEATITGLIRQVNWDWARLQMTLARAFEEHAAGNYPEARVLLNQALDIEFSVTGDCALLGDLAEEWGVDYERDNQP
jgi:hypothetical protein